MQRTSIEKSTASALLCDLDALLAMLDDDWEAGRKGNK